MRPSSCALISLSLLISSAAYSADIIDQQQTSGGDEYRFAYAIESNNVSKKIARQSFVPVQNGLSKVEIGLYANYNGSWPPCQGSTEKFDVSILNSNLDTIASKTGLPVCGLPTKVGFNPSDQMTAVSVTASLTPGDKYWIETHYTGKALCYDGPCTDASLIWVRSSGDAYPKGESWTIDTQANNSRDFIFRTYGPSNSPPNTCTLSAPSDGAGSQALNVTLDWNCTDPNGNGDIVDYYLQFDDNGDFSSPLKNGYLGGVATDWNPSAKGVNLAYATTYYWRVYAKDKQGATSPPGTRWSFTTVPDPNRCLDGSPKDNIGDPCVHDEDKDMSPDGVDACPFDSLKSQSAGQCGCGKPDTDTDGDKTADCNDGCVGDPNKVNPGLCGCGIPEGCECVQGQTRPCGSNVGECREGTQSCAGGKWAGCAGAVNPIFESCDGKDNDCDGSVDEGCNCIDGAAKACGPQNIGECKEGKQTCSSGQWGGCDGAVYSVAESCDGKDNDCDGATDDGGVCNSVANCGVFGKACAADQICHDGQCVVDFDQLVGKHVIMSWELFEPVAEELVRQRKVNEVFYTESSNEDATKALLGLVSLFKSGISVFNYVMLHAWQYKVLYDMSIIKSALSAEPKLIIQNADGINDIVYLAIPEAKLAKDRADALIYRTDRYVRALEKLSDDLKKIGRVLTGVFAIYNAATYSDGDPAKFFMLGTGYAGFYFNPMMINLALVKIAQDIAGPVGSFAWGVVNIDPREFTCDLNDPAFQSISPVYLFSTYEWQAKCGISGAVTLWDTLDSVLDGLFDPKLLSDIYDNAFSGECSLYGKTPGCVEAIGQGLQLFSNPFPFIEDIDVAIAGNRIVFREHMKDYNIVDYGTKDIWVGASILSEDYLGCNYDLPPKSVSFSKGLERDVEFDYTLPEGFRKEKEFKFVSKVWYHCIDCSPSKVDDYSMLCKDFSSFFCKQLSSCTKDFLGYKQCNPGEDNYYYCYGDELEQLGISLSGAVVGFTLENALPVINNVRCDAPAIWGIPCPETIEIETGDELKVTAFANDPDGSSLDINTAGDIGFVRSCSEEEGYDEVCTFTHEALPDDVGEHWFKVNAYDGYDTDSRQFVLKIAEAALPTPEPARPAESEEAQGEQEEPAETLEPEGDTSRPDSGPPAPGCSLVVKR